MARIGSFLVMSINAICVLNKLIFLVNFSSDVYFCRPIRSICTVHKQLQNLVFRYVLAIVDRCGQKYGPLALTVSSPLNER